MSTLMLKSRQWLEDGDGNIIMGEGRQRIFELIEETGSINQTAKMMRMSYRGVWGKIKATEEHIDKKIVLTERRHGSRLTEDGKELLRNYRQLKIDCQKADEDIFRRVFKGE
jgi:molybdate transport system regulatory protein